MTAATEIRPCRTDDDLALSLVGQATFLETFAGVLGGADILAHCASAHSADHYRTWLATPSYALWLVEAQPGDAPVGYMVVAPAQLPLPDATSDDLELKRIYLLNKFRGGGIGRRLLEVATKHTRASVARRLLLGVYAHNDSAIAFYERVGFRSLGSRKFNVGGKDYDDIIMRLSLAT